MSDLVGQTLGEYRLIALLGSNKTTAVYKGYHPELYEYVVVKVFDSALAADAQFVAQLRRQTNALNQLNHPHIVQLFETTMAEDRLYTVMEFIEGVTLAEELAERREKGDFFEVSHALFIIYTLATVLEQAHAHDLLHYNLRPSNILFTAENQLVLTDFDTPMLSVPRPPYTEQPVTTPQSNLYSLGMILAELLPAAPPEITALVEALTEGHINQMSELRHAVTDLAPTDLQQVILSTIANTSQVKQVETVPTTNQAVRGRPGECPYRGLFPFREEDAPLFFGREAFIDQLLSRVRQQSMVVVVGPSGSGKSSVIFAGLIPILRQDSYWHVLTMRPGSTPFEALAAAIITHFDQDGRPEQTRRRQTEQLAAHLRNDPTQLIPTIRRYLPTDEQRVLVVIDQFEEVYTLCQEQAKRQRFLDTLLTAINQNETERTNRLCFALTLRADFLGQTLGYRPFADLLPQVNVLLGPMTREELIRAIRNPALRHGVTFDVGLIERILNDVGNEPGNLPLLEFALMLLWSRQNETHQLTHQAYEKIGRVEGALARYADETFNRLSAMEQEAARHIFLQMVRPGKGTEDTRRLATRTELGEQNWQLVGKLADTRLMVTGQDPTGMETVEVVHEALIRSWSRLREWLNTDREFLLWRQRLRIALTQWEQSDRQEGALLQGIPLSEAENWLQQRHADLNSVERLFVQQSLDERSKRRVEEIAQKKREETLKQRIRTGLYLLITVLTIAMLIALGLMSVAFRERDNAERERQRAEAAHTEAMASQATAEIRRHEAETAQAKAIAAQATTEARQIEAEAARREAVHQAQQARERRGEQLVALARSLVATDNQEDLSLLLAQEAYLTTYLTDGYPPLEADSYLRTLLDTVPPWHMTLPAHRHTGAVLSARYSPKGRFLVTTSADQSARVWDIESHQQVAAMLGHQGDVVTGDFSPDGQLLATGGVDHTIRLWDVNTGELLETLRGHAETVSMVRFHPHEPLLTSASADQTVRLWNINTGDLIGQLTDHTGAVNSVAFSPNGQKLVTASDDTFAFLWRLSPGEPEPIISQIGQLRGHTAPVNSAMFSPDGQLIITASRDQTVRLWEAPPEQSSSGVTFVAEVGRLPSLKADVQTASFNPAGTLIVTASDVAARLFDATTLEEVTRLSGHIGFVLWASFSPTGETVVTTSDDQTIRLWDMAGEEERLQLGGHGAMVLDARFSSDGELLVTSNNDALVRLWERASGTKIAQLQGHERAVSAVVLVGDELLASGSADQTVRLWNINTGELLETLRGHEGAVNALAAVGDALLASGSADQTVRLWNINTGELLETLRGHEGAVNALVAVGDELLASGSADQTVRLWNINTGELLETLRGHEGAVNAVAFADEALLASGSADQTVRLWNINTGELLETLRGHTGAVNAVAFADDERLLASASADRTIGLWSLQTMTMLRRYTGHQEPVNSVAFSPAGDMLVSASDDKTARLWHTQPYTAFQQLRGHTEGVVQAALNPTNNMAVTVGKDETVRLWQVSPMLQALPHQIEALPLNQQDKPYAALFSPTGELLVTAGDAGVVQVWDVATRQVVREWQGHAKAIRKLAFDPTGSLLATASDDQTVRVWSLTTGEEIQRFEHTQGRIWSVAFSPNGQFVLSSSGDIFDNSNLVRWWSVATGAEVGRLPEFNAPILTLEISPRPWPEFDAYILATAGGDAFNSEHAVQLWAITMTAQTATPVGQLEGHTELIWSLAFSPDGVHLASAGADHTARVWQLYTPEAAGVEAGERELPLMGREISRLQGPSTINSVAFGAEGRMLITASDDQLARLWPLSALLLQQTQSLIQREPPVFTPAERERFGLD